MVIFIKKILFVLLLIILGRIIYISIYKNNYYQNKLKDKTIKYTYGLSYPRGRILDRNGKVLVDNTKSRVIIYNKINSITTVDELLIAEKLSKYLGDNFNISDDDIAIYIFDKTNDYSLFLSKDEKEKYQNQIYTYSDIKNISLKYIKKNLLNSISFKDKKIAKIYSLMNKDYHYDKKIIFKDISDKEYFKILNLNLKGISGEYIYERIYPYGNLLRNIYGNIGNISKDNKEEYLNKGYLLSDIVGTSYLEKEYEDTLKGKKAKYIVLKDGTLKRIKEEIKGNDITLNIDIDIELKLEEIMKKHILNARGKINAEYYSGSYVLVSSPNGEVIALLGLKLSDDGNFYDTTTDVVHSSFVVGSVVKGASNTVAYHENVINRGKKIKDSCIKLYMNTIKCSYKDLGYVDDISAIEKSSNYYQFYNALKIMGYDYKYNMKVTTDNVAFNKYRNIFKTYGLGDKTYIDLPNESIGLKGTIIAPDLLLNLSIGQYDAYTPMQLLSYINTISNNGVRKELSLLNKENKVVSKVDISKEDLDRIKLGMHNVLIKGTANNYIINNDGIGKTGTSETLIDTDNDGIYETKTISTAFIGSYPYNDPKYTFVIISPNISSNKVKNNYKVPINRYIIHDLTEFLFEK